MNKIAQYLNEHLLGDVSSLMAVRKHYSTDRSILSLTPDTVVFPRNTNDIRKVARFTWQLAEKGHVIGLTSRGFGTTATGAAIGKGVTLALSQHLSRIIQIVPKDKLVQVQPGISITSLQETLKWHGLTIPSPNLHGSLGGSIANESLGDGGSLSRYIERLEVVLANGDVIETGRFNKREVSKKQGQQTLEGEIYRKIAGLIEDNQDLIQRMTADEAISTIGYSGISQVRAKDGSFDLTPLFIGSQGTLGIISEVVLRTEFYGEGRTDAIITCGSRQEARDIAEHIVKLAPSVLRVLDGALYKSHAKHGSKSPLLGDVTQLGAVVYVRFNDFSDRARQHKVKKLKKLVRNQPVGVLTSYEHPIEEFELILDVAESISLDETHGTSLPIMDGAYVPVLRREEFEDNVAALARKHHVTLPLILNVLTGTYDVYSALSLETVSDKQRIFKIMNDYAQLVDAHDGAYTSDGAEGRLKANAAWSTLDDDEADLYEGIREAFDPLGTLNPGVKQKNDLRDLISALRSTYDTTARLN